MRKETSAARKFKVGQYAVLYFDLMGVRQSLFRGIDYHSSEVDQEKQFEIDRTCGSVLGFLKGIKGLHEQFTRHPEELYEQFMAGCEEAKSPDHRAEFLRQVKCLHVGIQQGSDTTLLYVKDDCEVAQMIVSMWMLTLPLYILSAMSKGVLVRGCLTRGTGWEMRKNCLFGPVIHEAAVAEEATADYPRIVVTGSFYSMCATTLARMQISQPPPTCSINPFKMLDVDVDGHVVFDYLGAIALAGLKEMYEKKGYGLNQLEKMINQARDFVLTRLAENRNNKRLSDIYQKLLFYINDRLRKYIVTIPDMDREDDCKKGAEPKREGII